MRTVTSRNLVHYVSLFFRYKYCPPHVYNIHDLTYLIPSTFTYHTCLDVLAFCESAFFEIVTVKEFA